jgi:hypothetical protein
VEIPGQALAPPDLAIREAIAAGDFAPPPAADEDDGPRVALRPPRRRW